MKTGLRRIHYFLVLTGRLNFRRAAAELAISQPALSRAIAQLEAEIGVTLLERTNRKVALTEAGEVFRDRCREAVAALDRAGQQARKAALGEAGRLVIGYTDMAIAGPLPGIVRSFSESCPDVSVTLLQYCSEEQYERLRAEEIEFGFLTGPVDQPGLDSLAVQVDRFVAILPAGHPLAAADSIRLADLSAEPFVLGTEEKWRVYHRQLYTLCREEGFEPLVVQRAPDTQGIVGLVACGMGVSIQTETLKLYSDARVRVVPLTGCNRSARTYAVWRRADARASTRMFAAHLRATSAACLRG